MWVAHLPRKRFFFAKYALQRQSDFRLDLRIEVTFPAMSEAPRARKRHRTWSSGCARTCERYRLKRRIAVDRGSTCSKLDAPNARAAFNGNVEAVKKVWNFAID